MYLVHWGAHLFVHHSTQTRLLGLFDESLNASKFLKMWSTASGVVLNNKFLHTHHTQFLGSLWAQLCKVDGSINSPHPGKCQWYLVGGKMNPELHHFNSGTGENGINQRWLIKSAIEPKSHQHFNSAFMTLARSSFHVWAPHQQHCQQSSLATGCSSLPADKHSF